MMLIPSAHCLKLLRFRNRGRLTEVEEHVQPVRTLNIANEFIEMLEHVSEGGVASAPGINGSACLVDSVSDGHSAQTLS